jgi:hypothetical protein
VLGEKTKKQKTTNNFQGFQEGDGNQITKNNKQFPGISRRRWESNNK